METRRNGMFVCAILAVVFFAVSMCLCMGAAGRSEALFYERAAAAAAAVTQDAGGRDMLPVMMRAFKEPRACDLLAGRAVLREYGYDRNLLPVSERGRFFFYGSVCAFIMAAAFFVIWNKGEKRLIRRIEGLTDYLKQINGGVYPMKTAGKEDEFSILEDELYKTVVELRESRERAEAGKANLAANLADISHQLKTPLTSMALTAELLEMKAEGEEQKKAAGRLLSQADRMSGLVYMLLTLSRLDAGVLPFSLKETGVGELISCARDTVDVLLADKKQSLAVCGDLDGTLVCDPGWTIQALSNLLKNCSEHAPEESEIRLTVKRNPIFLQIVMEDRGPGFNSEDLKHLFERFYKGKDASNNGAGLGLAFARSILERENASVGAENGREGGAVFRIKFYAV